jgi:hypothetical protein
VAGPQPIFTAFPFSPDQPGHHGNQISQRTITRKEINTGPPACQGFAEPKLLVGFAIQIQLFIGVLGFCENRCSTFSEYPLTQRLQVTEPKVQSFSPLTLLLTRGPGSGSLLMVTYEERRRRAREGDSRAARRGWKNAWKCKKDVKFNGTNPTSPLESVTVSKKRTQSNSKRTGKTCCKYAKKPKRSERMTSKRQVQEARNYPLQGGIIALASRRDGNDRRFVSTAFQITSSRRR